jgi:hypothetical protein
MALHNEGERIFRELGNKDGPQISLSNQGNILYLRGDLDVALGLHKEEERISAKTTEASPPQSAVDTKSLLDKARELLNTNQPEQALKLISPHVHRSSELKNAKAVCLLRLKDTKGAIKLLRKLVLPGGGVTMATDIPDKFKTNYATTLLMSDNIDGCLNALSHVLGNHEYYGKAIPKHTKQMRELFEGSNVRVLENDRAVIDGVVFLGCTLWTDFRLFGDPRVAGFEATQKMTDYKKIRVSPTYRRLRSIDTAGEHYQSLQWLTGVMGSGLFNCTSEDPTL